MAIMADRDPQGDGDSGQELASLLSPE